MSRQRPRRGPLRAPVRADTAAGVAQVVADPERPGGRLLLIDGVASGYVDLRDPARLGLDYLHRLGVALDVLLPRGAPADVVHIGGGAFALPRALAATRPAVRQEVLELDPDVVALARAHLRLRLSPTLRVRCGDGRALLDERAPGSADAVVGDAFRGLEVPRHLTTVEFASAVRRVLRPDGVYLLNVVDGARAAAAPGIAAALLAVFASVVAFGARAVVCDGKAGNVLFAASARQLDAEALGRRLATGPHPSVVRAAAELAAGAAAPRDAGAEA